MSPVVDFESSAAVADEPPSARLVTIRRIHAQIAPRYMRPVPTERTLAAWMKAAKIRRFKTGAQSARGGGPSYYNEADVDRWFRHRVGL